MFARETPETADVYRENMRLNTVCTRSRINGLRDFDRYAIRRRDRTYRSKIVRANRFSPPRRMVFTNLRRAAIREKYNRKFTATTACSVLKPKNKKKNVSHDSPNGRFSAKIRRRPLCVAVERLEQFRDNSGRHLVMRRITNELRLSNDWFSQSVF